MHHTDLILARRLITSFRLLVVEPTLLRMFKLRISAATLRRVLDNDSCRPRGIAISTGYSVGNGRGSQTRTIAKLDGGGVGDGGG